MFESNTLLYYINDILKNKNIDIALFADDTAVTASSVNTKKLKIKKLESNNIIQTDNIPINTVKAMRDFGLTLDRKRNCKEKIETIKIKEIVAYGMLQPYMVKFSALSLDMKLQLFRAYVRLILTYA